MEGIIRIKDLSKSFNGMSVLEGINMDINKGEFISIIGPSGCGKTTLLKVVCGLLKETQGSIKIGDSSILELLKNNKVSFVFQNPNLLPWRTALQNILLAQEIVKNKYDAEYAKQLLELVGLQKFEKFYPKELSGGMQQRVSIARALSIKPSILLMDEPFGALDEITRENLNLELLKIWNDRNNLLKNIIFVTHSIQEAVFLSDKVIIMSKLPGKIKSIIEISLPKPRTVDMKNSTEFYELVKCIRKKLN